jgi:hypothetical protein
MIIAFVAIFGMVFTSCEGDIGSQGDQGDQGIKGPDGEVDLVVDLDAGDAEFTIILGLNKTLTAVVNSNALVQTVVWELYDDAAKETLKLDRAPRPLSAARSSILSGDSVVVSGLKDGEGKIVVTALGSSNEPIQRIITVTVEGLMSHLPNLSDLVDDADLPVEFIFTAYADERIPPQLLDFDFGATVDETQVTIILKGAPGTSPTLFLDGTGPFFTVDRGVELILENITLQGIATNNRALVLVNNGGTLTMNEGSKITGNTNTTTAVTTAVMQGGGVCVTNGTFNMNEGAEISNNRALHGAGVEVNDLGIFNMDGGTITGNTTTGTAGTGGGVRLTATSVANRSFFNMEDGTISNNTAANGGGVNIARDGIFEMVKGTISGNTTTGSGFGGGVRVAGTGAANMGTFIMRGGIISGNRAGVNGAASGSSEGGGVAKVPNGQFRMHGGTISRNEAAFGGGVANEGAGRFTMSGGVISSNRANTGGGIDNWNSTTIISGGIIHGSNAGSLLRNVASGAAFRSGGGGVFQRGQLDEEHVASGVVAFPWTSTNNTVEVEAGVIVSSGDITSISLTGLPPIYEGAEADLYILTGASYPHIGSRDVISGAASWTVAGNRAAGTWEIVFEFYEQPWTPESIPIGFYVIDMPLVAGANTITYSQISGPSPVRSLTQSVNKQTLPAMNRTLSAETQVLPMERIQLIPSLERSNYEK